MIYRTPEEQAKLIIENSIYGVTGNSSITHFATAQTVMQRLKAENNIDKLPHASNKLPF